MNNLPCDKQIEIIAALCEGVGQRAVSRLTETDRKTVARMALAVGTGCAELARPYDGWAARPSH
jgi:hypothetical protein